MSTAFDSTGTLANLVQAHTAFLWQATAIALAARLVLAFVPSRRANVRYLVLCAALAGTALAPVVTLVLASTRAPASFESEAALASAATTVDPSRPVRSTPAPALSSTPRGTVDVTRRRTLELVLVALWLVGVASLSAHNLRCASRARRLGREGVVALPDDVRELARALATRLGIRRAVRVAGSNRIDVPIAWGFLRPLVLLPPSALLGLSRRELETVLAHELAHVRRHDALVNLAQIAVETLFFHHPAVWWLSHAIRVEREHCCDDLAVALCGDRRTYARALATLEESRLPVPRVALSATGGSLVVRIARILGRSARPELTTSPNLRGIATMIAVTILTACAFTGALPASSLQDDAASKRRALEPTALASDLLTERGLWFGRGRGNELELDLRLSSDRDSWTVGLSTTTDELEGFRPGDEIEFRLVREAGTFTFRGDFLTGVPESDGTGRFEFEPSASFANDLREAGYEPKTKDFLILAAVNVGSGFLRELNELGYQVTLDELISMAIHGVTPAFIRSLSAVGYENVPQDELVAARIHGVDADLARTWAERLGGVVPLDELQGLSIHGVTPEFADALHALGYTEVDADELRSLQIHGVDPNFLRGLAARFSKLPELDEAISFAIHGVTEEFMDTMTQRFPSVTPDDFVSLSIHGVTIGFADALLELGYDDLDLDQLVSLRIHDVGPQRLLALTERLGERPTLDDAISLSIHGATPAFIDALTELGVVATGADDFVSMRIHGVTADWVRDLRARGVRDLEAQALVGRRIRGERR